MNESKELETYICQFCKQSYQSNGSRKPKSFRKDDSIYQYYDSTLFCSKECANKIVGLKNKAKRLNMSQEEKDQLKQKISQKVRVALQNRSKEERVRYSKVCSEKMKRIYQHLTQEDKQKLGLKISEGLKNFNRKHPESTSIRSKRCHQTCLNRTQQEKLKISEAFSQRAICTWNKMSEENKQKRNQNISTYWKTHKNELQNKIQKAQETLQAHPEITKQAVQKGILTKRKNNTFNTSKPENKLYELLKQKYTNVKRNYNSDKRYPFMCDFYIPSKDLFIELQASWTHGGKLFNSEDISCLDQLNSWKQKSLTSKYYKNAIETWTIRDVRKRNIAQQNKLNYIEV